MALSYCIEWINYRSWPMETHTGPELWHRGDFDQPMDENTVIPAPRPKTYQEALELATRMNNSLEFHNQSHQVVIYKGKKQADRPNSRREVTPVYLLPKTNHGRQREPEQEKLNREFWQKQGISSCALNPITGALRL